MIKIRLARLGVRQKPYYRIVAIDERKKSSAPALAILGHWHPEKKKLNLDKEKLAEWVKKGAQVSKSVTQLLS